MHVVKIKKIKKDAESKILKKENINEYNKTEEVNKEKNKKSKKKKGKKKKNKKKYEEKYLLCNNYNASISDYVAEILDYHKFIFYKNQLYKYEDDLGYFVPLEKQKAQVIINEYLKKCNKKERKISIINDILALIIVDETIQMNHEIEVYKNLINFNNGVLNIKKNKIMPFSYEYYFFNSINGYYEKFNKKEYKESKFAKFILDITNEDKQIRKLIQEIFGYTISNYNNAKKLFVFYGESNCGKSLLLQLLTYMLGSENVSNIPLQDLQRDDYIAGIYNKKANICAELPETFFKNAAILKKLVSENDDINARRLHEKVFSFKNTCKLIAACNNLPKIDNKTRVDNTAFFNRLIIIPCYKTISDEELNPYLLDELKKEINIIISWSIEGLYRYIDNGCRFSDCDKGNLILKKYINQNNRTLDKHILDKFVNQYIELDINGRVYMEEISNKYKEYVSDIVNIEITQNDINNLRDYIKEKFICEDVEYKKFRKGDENKRGFIGIKIRGDN